MPYYNVKVPYSEVNYVMGPRDENYLGFTLGSQVSPGLYFGMDLNVQSCLGTFINQRSQDNQFRAVVKTTSKNQRYNLTFNYIPSKFL